MSVDNFAVVVPPIATHEFVSGAMVGPFGTARQIRAADVDGDNALELEELEMCVVSMNPKAEINPKDIARVWRVLNPENKFEISTTGGSF